MPLLETISRSLLTAVSELLFSINECIFAYKFNKNGSYYSRLLRSEQNKTNPMPLGKKLKEEIKIFFSEMNLRT